MQLVCKRPFGNFKSGDTVEVPDDAVFDEYHFERVPDRAAKKEGK